jgi:hypothetical protein
MAYRRFLPDYLAVYLIGMSYDSDLMRRQAARLLLNCLKRAESGAEVRARMERSDPAVAAAARKIAAELGLRLVVSGRQK